MLIRHAFCKRLGVRSVASLLLLSTILLAFGSAFAQEGSLRVGFEIPVQLDPAFASSDAEIAVLNAVYDYLVDVDAGNNLVPRLASGWTVADDGLTYTFALREGVTFHDGSALTSADVVFTFDRLRDAGLELPTADLYSNIVSVVASGDLEVTFTLAETNPFFLFDLSDNHALVVQAGASDLGSTFNGTGPFVVESYQPEDRMVLSANPNYFVEGKPGVAELEMIFFADQAASVSALRGGQLDLIMRMPTPLFQSLQNANGIETLVVPTNGFDLIRLRNDRAPGNDPRVVEALKLGIDRVLITEVVTDGTAVVGSDSPIGPLYEAYHRADITPPARDPERARELLAEAGYPDGLSLTLHTPDSGDRPDLAVVLKEQLAEAGFDIEIAVEPESVYYGENNWLEVDFGITGWGSRPIPQFYLDVMLVCGAVWNESHYCNEEFDRLAGIAGTTLDEGERIAAYAEIQSLLASSGPIVIPYFFPQFGAISEDFTGLAMKAFPGRTDLALITLR
jgi:peptide/nickel transport system substrate-binding protein